MLQFIVIAALATILIYIFVKGTGLFYQPNRCPRCKGEGSWRGTRPDERITCDECFGTGKKTH